jgi:hypothetical protein
VNPFHGRSLATATTLDVALKVVYGPRSCVEGAYADCCVWLSKVRRGASGERLAERMGITYRSEEPVGNLVYRSRNPFFSLLPGRQERLDAPEATACTSLDVERTQRPTRLPRDPSPMRLPAHLIADRRYRGAAAAHAMNAAEAAEMARWS